MPILFFVNCERTVLFSVKRDLEPPLPPYPKISLFILQIFFTTHAVLKIGEYHSDTPQFSRAI